ncbi:uncharacterized protein LOC113289558 isoform X1 [Papaver somniferum]|uniref:uncharacterized protein LOC113289558 isoform X1 n=2 Tax=Papaver somniferum TaxID=3469 RepID=UPI000E6FEEDC|nr:uncharacterized protein LOC113289558 isoform X1 [Papaver somniferum]
MGCTSSKLDDLPAVSLCRERCKFLDDAIKQRYELANSHVVYIDSLKEIGVSLNRFFDHESLNDYTYSSIPSPILNLPPAMKKAGLDTDSQQPVIVQSSAHHNHSHSNSGSHLHFHSDDDDDDEDEDDSDDDGSLHSSGNMTPSHYNHQKNETQSGGGGVGGGGYGGGVGGYGGGGGGYGGVGGGFMNMNFMQNRSTQSVVYQQRPMSPDTVHMSEASSSYYQNPNQQNNGSYGYYNYPPQPQPSYSNYGFYGSVPPYGSAQPYGSAALPPQIAASSSSKPPPPPSPPRASAWDFLNPFETVEKYYPPTTPSRDSREVRDEEGIPDLEDENYVDEVVKEVHGNQRFSGGPGNNYSKMVADEGKKENAGEALYQARPSVSKEKEMRYEVHVVDKGVASKEKQSGNHGNAGAFKDLGVSSVLQEIRAQFERASLSGNEVSEILESGKLPYHRKNVVYQASSKMLHSITPSLSVVSALPSTSRRAQSPSSTEKSASDVLDFEEDRGTSSTPIKLSSTLQKLYMWEKKLYAEVKSEEKMRVDHERKSKRLKRLAEKGAEAIKIETTQKLVRTLSTKMRIAIQVVDKISDKINKLRDEELWPQVNELINGFVRMWKTMLECHHSQCQVIAEAKNLDAFVSGKNLSDAHLEATFRLELELQRWTLNFTRWVAAQKGYIKNLNSWLLKCLLYEPEETDDGLRPFSPSSIGAPIVFVICNQWSQAMDIISEREVIDAMRSFTMSVFQIWEEQNQAKHNMIPADKDIDRKAKALEREEQKMQKMVQAMDKQVVQITGHMVLQADTKSSSLQSGLKLIFQSMEKFTADSMQAFNALQARIEEQRARVNTKRP